MLIVEGEGESTIGGTSIAWKPLDIITLPQWNYVLHRCTKGPARIFVVTDREVLRRLRVYHSNLKADEGLSRT
jgi:gentisate 1,2-dioxygenase